MDRGSPTAAVTQSVSSARNSGERHRALVDGRRWARSAYTRTILLGNGSGRDRCGTPVSGGDPQASRIQCVAAVGSVRTARDDHTTSITWWPVPTPDVADRGWGGGPDGLCRIVIPGHDGPWGTTSPWLPRLDSNQQPFD